MASTFPPPAVQNLASEVSTLLKERSESVCVAETVRFARVNASILCVADPAIPESRLLVG